jgi:hypothetical protein
LAKRKSRRDGGDDTARNRRVRRLVDLGNLIRIEGGERDRLPGQQIVAPFDLIIGVSDDAGRQHRGRGHFLRLLKETVLIPIVIETNGGELAEIESL